MCGMGGDLFALVHDPNGDGAVQCLNSSGRAGSGADAAAAALRDEGHTAVPFRDDIRVGHDPRLRRRVVGPARTLRPPPADRRARARDRLRRATGSRPSSPARMTRPLMGTPPRRRRLRRARRQLVRRPGVADALRSIAADGRVGVLRRRLRRGPARARWRAVRQGRSRAVASGVDRPPSASMRSATDLWTAPPNSQGYLALAAAWIARRSRPARRPRRSAVGASAGRGVAPGGVRPQRRAARRADGGRARRARAPRARDAPPSTRRRRRHWRRVRRRRHDVHVDGRRATAWASRSSSPTPAVGARTSSSRTRASSCRTAAWASRSSPAHPPSPERRAQAAAHAQPDDGHATPTARCAWHRHDGRRQPAADPVAAPRPHAGARRVSRRTPWPKAASFSRRPNQAGPASTRGRRNGRVRVRVEANAPDGWADGLAERGHVVEPAPAFDSRLRPRPHRRRRRRRAASAAPTPASPFTARACRRTS